MLAGWAMPWQDDIVANRGGQFRTGIAALQRSARREPMAVSKAAHDSLNGIKPLNGRAGGGAAPVNGFNVPSNLQEFVHSDKYLTLAIDPEGLITPEVSIAKLRFHAQRMALGHDGIRHSRAVWVSKTKERLEELEEAFLEACPGSAPDCEFGRAHTFTAPFGRDVDCEVLFRVYERSDDASRMPPASFFIFDDFYKAGAEVFGWAANRVGLYPDRESGPGCVTEDGKRNRIIWGIARSSWGIHYLDGMKADLEDHVHLTKLHQGSASEG